MGRELGSEWLPQLDAEETPRQPYLILRAIGVIDQLQAQMTHAAVMSFAITSSRLVHGNYRRTRRLCLRLGDFKKVRIFFGTMHIYTFWPKVAPGATPVPGICQNSLRGGVVAMGI